MADLVQNQDGEWIAVNKGEGGFVRQGDQTLRLDPSTGRYKPF